MLTIETSSINQLRSLAPFITEQSMDRSIAVVNLHPNRNHAANPHGRRIRYSFMTILWPFKALNGSATDCSCLGGCTRRSFVSRA